MNNVKDEDLILLYYGEHEDPELARGVAQTAALAARFKALSEMLETLDGFPLPDPGPDYGVRVWNRIAPRLEPLQPRWRAALQHLLQPRVSLAGVAALLIIVMASFWTGRQSYPGARIDPQRLLAEQVSTHLGRTDMLLTEYVNGADAADDPAWAANLLLANRVYRQAAKRAGHPRLAALLQEMETLLIEMANDHGQNDAGARQLKNYVDDDLLFRVRVMQDKLVRNPEQA